MNKDNAKDYLPLIQALAEGKTIQSGQIGGSDRHWVDNLNVEFSNPPQFYRIKPDIRKGWYRVAALKPELGRSSIGVADSEEREKAFEWENYFICWLTDRIEYTLPEGDA